ncbi:GTP-binding protein 2 [Plutella xylostella]|uniref:GTP-binding protein 2 n=1 Tax=Plutella xylostella TaxID=51655 RepID=UPI0020331430|nr:GTP-binding protein 2 [Plutella xylostella]
MDSFFSLFDPSEGQGKSKKKHKTEEEQETAKAPDAPKGRRRGRRSDVKHETLPEESSFLCEPVLSADTHCADQSYFDNHFEVATEESKSEADKKPKRRTSTRKTRRKKYRVSPAKETPSSAWTDELEGPLLNNRTSFVKPKTFDVGKNVNNLKEDIDIDSFEYVKKSKRKAEPFDADQVYHMPEMTFDDEQLYGTPELDSFEDLPTDLVSEELNDNEVLSCSDDEDDISDIRYASELEECSAYGSLPPEPRFGNVEYKLQLVSVTEKRFQHLVTQLKWRLRSGGGVAIYVVGVRDNGTLLGLRARALRASLHTLRKMAAALRASVTHVTARRVTSDRATVEVYIRKLADTQQSVELRLAVMGANEAGKSTLIGVLTQGELDNGRGSARLNMFRHVHEVRSGRTSSLSHEILGFDAQGNVVNYGCSQLMTAERIGERSSKLVSLLDLAGHSKYQRTTVRGLTGYCPHYAALIVSASAGITPVTEEHTALLLALELPFFIVVNKCDQRDPGRLLPALRAGLKHAHKKPLLITDESMARNCAGPPSLILDSLGKGNNNGESEEGPSEEIVPVFPVSCVTGRGLNALHAYLLALEPPTAEHREPEEESCEFQIDEIFHVGESSGPVVGGLLASGRLSEGDTLLIGPLDSGDFVEISVKTIYRNRVPCDSVKAGQSASLGLSHKPPNLRQGMVLLTIPENYKSNTHKRPTFGGCPPGKCKSLKEILNNSKTEKNPKNTKHTRRKEKNLLKDLKIVEDSLTKEKVDVEGNIYKSSDESDSDKDSGASATECVCDDAVLLDDPNNPRGCLYFQASIHLLRHPTAYIYPGFQCTVHIGNVRQTAVIVGIMSPSGVLMAGSRASVVFRFVRWAEYVRPGRRALCRAGPGSRAVAVVQQVFPTHWRD